MPDRSLRLMMVIGLCGCGGGGGGGDPIDADAVDAVVTDAPPTPLAVVELSLGALHSCARLADGSLRCWGGNFVAQLGDGVATHGWCFNEFQRPDCSLGPVSVVGLGAATALGASELNHTCAVVAGQAWCWGMNTAGQTGREPPSRDHAAIAISLADVVEVDAGAEHTCARTASGTVACWGANQISQLGDGSRTGRATPAPVRGLTGARSLALGAVHGCAVRADGTVACWGGNGAGQLGDGTRTDRDVATAVPGLRDVAELGAGHLHTCARTQAGAVWCWGDNLGGQLGDGTTAGRASPRAVPGIDDATALVVGGRVTCARRAGGTTWCWGANVDGQLGDGSADELVTRPRRVAALDGATTLGFGLQHGCAAFADGLRCWGRGDFGILGNGSEAWSRVPIRTAF